jgi:hypothetical protein
VVFFSPVSIPILGILKHFSECLKIQKRSQKMAIYDLRSAAGRLHGFFRKNPNSSPDSIRRFLETIEIDQKKSSFSDSIFYEFSDASRVMLKRYKADIDELYSTGKRAQAIETKLKEKYHDSKIKIPSRSTIQKYLDIQRG